MFCTSTEEKHNSKSKWSRMKIQFCLYCSTTGAQKYLERLEKTQVDFSITQDDGDMTVVGSTDSANPCTDAKLIAVALCLGRKRQRKPRMGRAGASHG